MTKSLEAKAPLPTAEVGVDGNKLKQDYADFLQANEKAGKKLENPLETFLLKTALAKENIKANPNYADYLALSPDKRKKVDASINQLRGEIRAAEGVPDIKIESPEEIEAKAKKVREAYAKKLAEEKKAVEEKAKADAAALAVEAESKAKAVAATPGEAATSVDQQQKAENGLSAEEAAKQIAETQAKFTNLKNLGKPDAIGKSVDLGFGVKPKQEPQPFTLLTPEFQQKSEAELRAKLEEAAVVKPTVVNTEAIRDAALNTAKPTISNTEANKDSALRSAQPKVIDTERVRDEALKSGEQPKFTAQQSAEEFKTDLAPESQNRKTPAEAFLETAPVPTTPKAKPNLFTKIFGGLMNSLKPKSQPEVANQAAPAKLPAKPN
jgi:hypothetical protein